MRPSAGWRRLRVALALTAGLAAVSACAPAQAQGGPLQVVAAESVYGSIASTVGGADVHVDSIISNPAIDPHEYTATSRDALAVDRARIVIRNGLGYDAFLDPVLRAVGRGHRVVLTVAQILGVTGTDPNPHLWYAVNRLGDVAAAIAAALSNADPADAADFQHGLAVFRAELAPAQQALAAVRQAHAGEPVAYTERVAGLLLDEAGLRIVTPSAFARSIEDGTDPSFRATAALRQLLTTHAVRVLVYNTQAESALTTQIRRLATAVGIPVVTATETLPPGESTAGWLRAEVKALARALNAP